MSSASWTRLCLVGSGERVVTHPLSRRSALLGGAGVAVVAGEAALIRLGLSYGSTPEERSAVLPGDAIVADPNVVTDHAITIDAPTETIWPWLVQMGWGRAQWYTARWVDRLLFPGTEPVRNTSTPSGRACRSGTSSLTGHRRPNAG